MKNPDKDRQAAQLIRFPPFSLRPDVDVLYLNGKVLPLEPNAVRVLRFLAENHSRVVSKQELLDTVWRDVFTTEDVLKKAVSQIRRTLQDDLRVPRYIETHHRRGYRFVAQVVSATQVEVDLPAPLRAFDTKSAEAKLTSDIVDLATKAEKINDADFNQFVGRREEIELLKSEFRRTLGGGGQPILIVGAPGIGKTQLSVQFESWARTSPQNALVLRARFYDYEAARISAKDLFFDLLKKTLIALNQKAGHKSFDTANLRQLAANLKIELPSGIYSSSDSSKADHADDYRFIAPFAESFICISRFCPLVLIFDDLQWADDLSRKIVGYLMRAGATEKLLILALARNEEYEKPTHDFAVWLNEQAAFRSFSAIELRPLSESDYKELLERTFSAKLDATTIPYAESNLIYRTTGGNPYFLIETLRMLLAENVIEKTLPGDESSTTWTWRGLSDLPLPETIRMAARGKLNRLNAGTKDYVEHAAILGDSFAVETLHEMFAGEKMSSSNELENRLEEAVSSQVLTEQNVSGADDCQFYHTTLRRAVYADLSPRRRRRLHLRAARAIETVSGGEAERIAGSLSVHYEAAGEARLCFEYALTAAALASRNFGWKEAVECATRAARAKNILDENAATRLSDADNLRLLLATGEAIMSTGKREEAEKILERAAVLATALDDEVSLAAARATQGHARVLLGRYRDALASSEEALWLSKKLNDDEGIADALLQIGSAQYTLGEFDLACETLQKVLDEKRSGDYRKAVALGKIGWVRALAGRYREGTALLKEALVFHETAGDARQRIVLSLCLNWCEHGLGEYESAIRHAVAAGDEAHQNLGESSSEAVAALRVGKSRAAQGLYAEAETLLNRTLARMENSASTHCQAEIKWFLGQAKLGFKQTSAAEKLLVEALEEIRRIGDREDEFRILIDVAELRMLQKDFAAALEISENAVSIAAQLQAVDGIGEAMIVKGRALLKLRNILDAHAAIKSAVELLDAAESGARWRAYAALAEVLQAIEENESIADRSKNEKASKTAGQMNDAVEAALRRAIHLLSEIDAQFGASAQDAARSRLFRQVHQKPARKLREILLASNRSAEAAQISAFWNLD